MKSSYFFRSVSRVIIVFILIAIAFGLQSPASVFADATDPGTGPGGVENLSNSSNLVLWLDANNITGNDGDYLGAWNDKSGYANNAAQSNPSFYPTLQTAELNGQSVVRFDGIDDSFVISDTNSLDGTSGLTIFTVINPASIDDQVRGVLSKRVDYQNQASYSLFFYNPLCSNPNCLILDINNNSSPGNRFTSDPYTLTVKTPTQLAVIYDGSAPSAELFANATSIKSTTSVSPTIPNYASDLVIGAINVGYTSVYSGSIAETIIFSKTLNTAEHTLVENYLSSKYDIDISSSGLDRYDGDTVAKNEYDLNVAGIGIESDGSNLNASSVGLFIANNSFLADNGDYVLYGHATLSNTLTTNNVPSGIAGRWSRDWYFDVTDISTNAGTVDLTFDFSDAGIAGPTGDASNYKLLSRTSTGDTFSILSSYSATLSGDRVTFSGVSVSDLESHYLTLGAVSVGPAFTLNVSVTGSGTVTSNPAGIDCGSDCSQSYPENTSVTLSAAPASGWSFSGWSGEGCSGTGTCIVSMTQARSVSATFTANTYTVTFDANGGDTPSPTSKVVTFGSTYGTLATTSRTGFTFAGWFTAASGGSEVTAATTVSTASDHTLYAHWTTDTYTLTIIKDGVGTGTVSSNPTGIDCGSDCTEDYTYTTVVTLTAVADAGSTFTGWSGAGCSGTGDCIVTMDAAKSVTATFEKYTIYLPIVFGSATTPTNLANTQILALRSLRR